MTDNDIIKAGECIKGEKALCLSCPYRARFPDCKKYVIRDIFALASRQEAEIKSCYEFIEQLKEARKIWDDKCKQQQAELERYERENNEKFDKWKLLDERTKERYAELYEEAKAVVRAEAVKEFAERLCDGRVSNDPVVIAVKVELKEMVGEG